MKSIYLDNAATSFPKPEAVYRAVDYCQRHLGANPGRGSSRETLKAASLLSDAREALAALFNIPDSTQIAFCLNITEAINTALKGILKPGDHVITSSMEHNAVARPLYQMTREGVEWTAVKCEPDGSLDPEEIRRAIRPKTRMICLLHASNLTGTVMPVAAIGKIARENGILFMLDTAQTAGVLKLDTKEQGIDILAFTGHKSLLGPQGTGGIYLKPGIDIKALKEGGTGSFSEELEHPKFMPDLLESGTINTPGIAGLLAGVNYIREIGLEKIWEQEQELTGLLIAGLREMPGVLLYGPEDIRKRTAVVAFNIKGMDCGELGLALDYEYGITIRSGLHCAPLAHKSIGTIDTGACRFSPGFFNSKEEIETAIKSVHKLAGRF